MRCVQVCYSSLPFLPSFLSVSLSLCACGGGYCVCTCLCVFTYGSISCSCLLNNSIEYWFFSHKMNPDHSFPSPYFFPALDLCPWLSLCSRSILTPCLFMKRIVFQESITKKDKARYNKIRQQLPIESGQGIHVGGSISRAGKRVREILASIVGGHTKTPN